MLTNIVHLFICDIYLKKKYKYMQAYLVELLTVWKGDVNNILIFRYKENIYHKHCRGLVENENFSICFTNVYSIICT